MEHSLNFQSIIMSLQNYWASQGCLIWQPYYTQVGAGTMNPATALRVLGPEPWNAAYVEPSIRPDDGRYGENPNRLQMHYQFQVILKPDPGNPQELYLQSLQALGINPSQHDIRFVEDNWESPALGAWGLGWEVWLDGQEITQFTYFQQSGGITLDPVSVELTYGLERIAIALQRVSSFREIQWSLTLTDGDVNLQAEQEHSRYYFEIADVGRLRQMYALFEQEAHASLEYGLILPAHDYLLKCSHTFNVLDTRGAIGVTERQAFFGRMRSLAKRIAETYLEQRRKLGYPWLKIAIRQNLVKPVYEPLLAVSEASTGVADFLLEIGVEELPIRDLTAALDQLRESVPALFTELRLDHGKIEVNGTPRRLAVMVEKVASRQTDLEEVYKGPPAAAAFHPDGSPTAAALGFARSKGLEVEDLQVRELEGGQYIVALVKKPGRLAIEALGGTIPSLLASLQFDKSMRWNQTNIAFSRPIRWLLSLLGDQVVPFEYAGLVAGSETHGLRYQQPQEKPITSLVDYLGFINAQGIVLSVDQRRKLIHSQIEALASEIGGEVIIDGDLLDEVTNLVEAPTVLHGSFDPAHLDLPAEVLISVMMKHQRYFPVYQSGAGHQGDEQKKLLPFFIFVVNKPRWAAGEACEGESAIKDGNQHVIRARFADAAYFVKEDLKKPLESYVARLENLTFQVKLGSMLDKTHRIIQLSENLAERLLLGGLDSKTTKRAALLCKADLATSMVVEMTSLQGVMGRYYAIRSGEPPEVAEAIYEHYLPRFAGDVIPKTRPGLVVGLADRLDSLAGLFAAGLAPTGSKDPFAQRRAALGLVQNLVAWDMDFNLLNGLTSAASLLPIPGEAQLKACLEFILERQRNLLLEQGERYDVIDAVLTAQGNNPAGANHAVSQLSAWVARSDWRDILPAYARCVRITRDLKEIQPFESSVLVEEAEKDLFSALLTVEAIPRKAGSVDDFLNAFQILIPAINRFFDLVLVMSEDLSLRRNRLGLLQRIAALAEGVADLSRLEGF